MPKGSLATKMVESPERAPEFLGRCNCLAYSRAHPSKGERALRLGSNATFMPKHIDGVEKLRALGYWITDSEKRNNNIYSPLMK